VISGNWKVKKVKLIDDATGYGLINGRSVTEIERNVKLSEPKFTFTFIEAFKVSLVSVASSK
jgi:hypothetical protein